MRNPIPAIAIAFVFAAPCTALTEEKKTIEIEGPSWGVGRTVGTPSTGSTASSQIKKFGIFKRTPEKVEAHSANGLTNKEPTTTNAPSALKTPNLLNGAGSGPTTGRVTIKVSPEYTRH